MERIAISLWRQRRLVTAETAAIDLSRIPRKIAGGVSSALALGYGSELKEDDLQPFDPERVQWCQAVIAEVAQLEPIDLASLPVKAPSIFEQLQSDAAEDGETVEGQLKGHSNGLTGYIGELLKWCHEQLAQAEQRPRVQKLADKVRARRLILPDEAIEIFSRYQTTLDNQLYKALRALREAQEWRLKTLEPALPATASHDQAA